MPEKADLLKELDWLSDKISSQVWTLNLAFLGTAWSLLIVGGPGGVRFSVRNAVWVLVPCIVSLLCQMAQYLCGYLLAQRLLREMGNRTESQYPRDSWFYRGRDLFHWCKIIFTTIAGVALVITLLQKFA
jgi:hypothetical protein